MTPCTVSSWPRAQTSSTTVVWQTFIACSITLSSQSRSSRSLLGERLELGGVLLAHVHHVAEPVVDQAVAGALERRLDAAAAVVAADDHVLHVQHVDRVLEHREAVEVGVPDDVGDVAMDEDLARREADDLVRGHAAVRAADPEVLGRLPLGEAGEVAAGPRRPSPQPRRGCARRDRRGRSWRRGYRCSRVRGRAEARTGWQTPGHAPARSPVPRRRAACSLARQRGSGHPPLRAASRSHRDA